MRLFGLWQVTARGVTCAYAHSQAGEADEERAIEAFLALQRKVLANRWLDLMLICD
jgi:hypothetical protein